MDSGLERDNRELDAWPLDGAKGPALALTEAGAEALTQRIVDGALNRPAPARRPRVALLAAIVVLGVATVAGAISLPRIWRNLPGLHGIRGAEPNQMPPQFRKGPLPVAFATTPPIPSVVEPSPRDAHPMSESGPPSPSKSSNVSKALERADAEDLLRLANQLRQKKDWSGAEAAYRKVARRHPRTAQAEVAILSAASLRLDHLADPEGALRLYGSLGPGGALTAEARFGMARCYRALGDVSGETSVLRQLIASGAVGLYAERARNRLRQLESNSP